MPYGVRSIAVVVIAAVFSTALSGFAGSVNSDYITPPFTFSPDHQYGVMIPVWHDEAAQDPDSRMNKVVELHTGRVVATIHAEPGYNRALNFRETAPPRWSEDSSLLLWKVNGKWFPDTLVLLNLKGGKEQWQLDLLKTPKKQSCNARRGQLQKNMRPRRVSIQVMAQLIRTASP